MNQRETAIMRMKTLNRYHLNGQPSHRKCRPNVVYINANNTLLHELFKTKLAHMLRKQDMDYITEACRDNIRRDLVCLDDGIEYEIIAENDTPEIRSKYNKEGVTIIEASWEGLKLPLLL